MITLTVGELVGVIIVTVIGTLTAVLPALAAWLGREDEKRDQSEREHLARMKRIWKGRR